MLHVRFFVTLPTRSYYGRWHTISREIVLAHGCFVLLQYQYIYQASLPITVIIRGVPRDWLNSFGPRTSTVCEAVYTSIMGSP